MRQVLAKIGRWLVWLLFYRIKICLPGVPIWLVLLVVGTTCLFFWLRSPGGRPFDDGTSDRFPIADIDKPENILNSFSEPLDAAARPFSAPVVLHLARACEAAYSEGETTVPKLFFDVRFDRVVPLTANADFATIGIKDKMAVIVFRGTNEIDDWYKNLRTAWTTIEHGNLHSGFWSAYISLRSQILDELKAQPLTSVWITGHSLGGAMAICCAIDLYADFPISGVVTFGQPKLADQELARYIDSILKPRYLAVVADEDPVADTVPLCQFCGDAIWFDGERLRYGERRLNVAFADPSGGNPPDIQDEPYFLDVMSEEELKEKQEMLQQLDQPIVDDNGRMVVRSIIPFFRDHNMANYIGKLRRYFSANNESP